MNPEDASLLSWIHSNKFVTTKLFHKKFRAGNSFQTACNDLEILSENKKLLKRVTARNNADSFYFLTRRAVHQLKDLGLILTPPKIRAPHQNIFEKDHDKKVIEIRIGLEKDPNLKNLIWLSDYEVRIGYKMDWKKALIEGRGKELKNVRLNYEGARKADGHFLTSIKNKEWEFILEYERSPYSTKVVGDVVSRILKYHSSPVKLIVAITAQRSEFLREKIGNLIKDPQDRASWWFSDFKTVTSLPFLETPWVDLDDFHPALIKPKEA